MVCWQGNYHDYDECKQQKQQSKLIVGPTCDHSSDPHIVIAVRCGHGKEKK